MLYMYIFMHEKKTRSKDDLQSEHSKGRHAIAQLTTKATYTHTYKHTHAHYVNH